MKLPKPFASMLFCLCAAPLAAHAAVVPSAAVVPLAADPAQALLTVFEAGFDSTAMIDNALSQMRGALLEQPDMIGFEKQHPGTVAQIVAAVRPVVARNSDRSLGQYHIDLMALIRNKLSPAEIRSAAEFYGSPLGAKMLRSISRNYSQKSVLREAIAGEGEITLQAQTHDQQATVAKVVAELTPADIEEIGRRLQGQSWLAALQALRPAIAELTLKMQNAPMSPEDEAAIEQQVTAIMTKRRTEKH